MQTVNEASDGESGGGGGGWRVGAGARRRLPPAGFEARNGVLIALFEVRARLCGRRGAEALHSHDASLRTCTWRGRTKVAPGHAFRANASDAHA